MNPDQIPAPDAYIDWWESLTEEDRKRLCALSDPRRRRLHGWGRLRFTTWQWAVLGSYIVAIVASLIIGRFATTAQNNTERIDKALCAQIEYLGQPRLRDDPQTVQLTADLRALVPSCPPPSED